MSLATARQTCCSKIAPAIVGTPASSEAPLAQLYESNNACMAKFVDSSIIDFSSEDPASLDVYHTKEVTDSSNSSEPYGSLDEQSAMDAISSLASSVKDGANLALKAHAILNKAKRYAAYTSTPDEDVCGNVLSRLEDFVMLTLGLASAQNPASYLAILHLYIRTHFTGSVSKYIWENILKLHQLTVSSDGDLDTQSTENFEKFLDFSRSSFSSWQDKKNSPFAAKMTDIISMLVACGFLGDDDMTDLTVGNIKLFKLRAFDKQMESMDFFEMVFDTLLFFVERGYQAIKLGDPTLLFHSDNDAAYIDTEYATLVAAIDLVSAGRLDALGDEFQNDQDYGERLDALMRKVSDGVKILPSGPARSVLANKLVTLKKLNVSLMLAQKKSPIRVKPFGVVIYGGSGVGKTSINTVLMKVLLSSNNFPSSKEHVVTLNDNDKFQSEYKGTHTGVTMDDHGNTKAEHYTESPCNKIIDFMNNVQKAALNPNVELKGNIMIRPKVVTVTTNVLGLLAYSFSNEPVSVLRRFNWFLDVRLRPEYTDPETGSLDSSKMVKFIEDAWIIDLMRVRIIRGKRKSCALSAASTDKHVFETPLKDASLLQVLDFLKIDSAKHFAYQETMVKGVEELYDMDLCPHSYAPMECAQCAAEALLSSGVPPAVPCSSDEDADESDDDSVAPLLLPRRPSDDDDESDCEDDLDVQAFFSPKNYECFYDASTFIDDDTEVDVTPLVYPHMRVLDAIKVWYDNPDNILTVTKTASESYLETLNTHRDDVLKSTLLVLGISGGIYATVQMIKFAMAFSHSHPQSGEYKPPELLPSDVVNPWKKVVPVRLFKSQPSRSTPAETLKTMLSHHMGHIQIKSVATGKTAHCVCVPIGHNDWIIPAHTISEGEHHVSVQTTKRDQLGKNFTEIIDEHSWTPLGADFVLLRLMKGGDVHDFSKYLCEEDFSLTSKMFGDIIYKDNDGFVSIETVALEHKKLFTSKFTSFEGVDYHCKQDCFPGMCMSPLVAKKKGGTIIGFHLAGRNGTNYGVAGTLTRPQYESAFRELNVKNSLVCHSTGNFPTSKFGIDFEPIAEIDARHSVRFLDGDATEQPTVEVIGAHGSGTARFRSQVEQLPISDTVEEVLGLPRIHGKPSNKCINKHWSRDLTQMAHPQGDFVPSTWRKATADFENHVDGFFEREPEMIKLVHPYPKDYVLSGMDGVTSVDRVDLTTSMGWPINKAKNNFLGPVERDVPGVTEAVDFEDPQYWAEVERIKDVLASGERVFAVHRGNLKDEPTKFTKDKIRVFAGCEFVFTCVVRELYLPIVRMIQTNWKDFECAVGINAHSAQWGELYDHITKYGTTNMIAGDYKAFDKSASPQAMMSAFEVLIKIAERAGYTKRQIAIMRGVATEISYPVYELNGVFVKLFGSNPSGHPLTVIINNIINCLYLRYAFFAIYPDTLLAFAEVIALGCYGDDNAMGVDDQVPDFNHTRVAEELAKVGITYTMADKEAESIPYVGIDEITFLKRGFVWSDDLNNWMAPIELASLSKSLHNYMKRKGNDKLPEEQAADALRNANMEFFYYGKEEFLKRRAQLQQVAEMHDISAMCTLDDYQDLVIRFKGSTVHRPVLDEADVPLDVQSAYDDLEEEFIDEAYRRSIAETHPRTHLFIMVALCFYFYTRILFHYTGIEILTPYYWIEVYKTVKFVVGMFYYEARRILRTRLRCN